ncbi:MAG: ribbon-helix-helix protein, CopG family [Actinomycetota bacterium]
MRTTVDLDERLMKRLKQMAVSEGTSLRAVIERLLRAALTFREANPGPDSGPAALRLGGPPRDLPLNDNRELRNRLDRPSS